MNLFEDLPDICRRNVPLGPLTWFGLGGPVEYLVEPQTVEQLATVIKRCHEAGIPVRLLGHGANILVPDRGVSGVVVRLRAAPFTEILFDGTTVTAGAGVDLIQLVRSTVRAGLAGLEVLAGIPGTVGGGICMNCGGRYGDIGSAVQRLRLIEPDGRVSDRDRGTLDFGYRRCELGRAVVISATFQLAPQDPVALNRRFRKILKSKQETQPPLGDRSAGCIFRNPNGRSAGALIDQAGFKGFRLGSARVSQQHANFILADQGGRAADVKRLVQMIRDRVEDNSGIRLEPEVRIW